jgi:hypothetical protein
MKLGKCGKGLQNSAYLYKGGKGMIIRTATCLSFAVVYLMAAPAALAQTGGETVVVTYPAPVEPGDLNWNTQRNVIESHQYDRLLETNSSFRMARIRKECGPITHPQLHSDCIASFDQYEPLATSTSSPRRVASSTSSHRHEAHDIGSSASPRHYQSDYAR